MLRFGGLAAEELHISHSRASLHWKFKGSAHLYSSACQAAATNLWSPASPDARF